MGLRHRCPTWLGRTEGDDEGSAVEDVDVPAGRFRAVRVEMELTVQNGMFLDPPQRYTQWYDPDVGLVKMTGKDGFSRVLKSVTLPVKKDR